MTTGAVARSRPRGRVSVLVLVSLGLVGFVVYAVQRAESRPSGSGAAIVSLGSRLARGDRVPLDLSLASLRKGAPLELAAVLGHRPAVVNFFSSWCPDCRAELGAFAAAWREHRGSVAFLGVDTNETSAAAARSVLRKAGAGYPVGVSDTVQAHSMGTAWRLVNGLPVTFFLDRRGRVAFEILGIETRSVLERRVAELAAGRPVT